MVAIAAVGVISVSAALIFESGHPFRRLYWWPRNNPTQRIRVLAAGVALFSFVLCYLFPANWIRLLSIGLLFFPLCAYVTLRISK